MTIAEWAEEDLKLAQESPRVHKPQRDEIFGLVTDALQGEFIMALNADDAGMLIYNSTRMQPTNQPIHLDKLLTDVLNQVQDTLPLTHPLQRRAVMAKVHKALFHQYKMQCEPTTDDTGVKAFDQYLSGKKGEPINLDAFILGVSTFLFNNL